MWCYDPAINEFALVHGDLAPCCDYNALTAGFTSVLGTLGEPSPNNSPGAVGGPSWVDLDGNFWKFGSIPFDLNEITTFNFYGPMMRFMPDTACLGARSALLVDSVSVEACNSYTNPLGDVYSQSGQYTYTLGNNGACSRQVVLDLKIILPQSTLQEVAACGSYTAATGEVFTQSTVFNYTLQAVNGCDSIVSVDLTIIEGVAGRLVEAAVGSVTQGGSVVSGANRGAASHQWPSSVGLTCALRSRLYARADVIIHSHVFVNCSLRGCR